MQSLSYYNLKKKINKKGAILVAGFFNQKRGYSFFIGNNSNLKIIELFKE